MCHHSVRRNILGRETDTPSQQRQSVPLLLLSSRLSKINRIHDLGGFAETHEEVEEHMDGCRTEGKDHMP